MLKLRTDRLPYRMTLAIDRDRLGILFINMQNDPLPWAGR